MTYHDDFEPHGDTGALLLPPPAPAVRIDHVSKIYRSSTQPVIA